ncbi:MAG: pyruvate kinase alpha/beta domain-containing protein [bacterium]|nr:pyruvate kinase alpha/beta domain-containing protein [bacterium]
MIEKKLCLFEETGKTNTEKCMQIVNDNLGFGYKYIVLATTEGTTALKFGRYFKSKGVKIIAVTHSTGFDKPSVQQVSDKTKEEIKSLGIELFTGTMLTHSLETALSKKYSGIYPAQIIASTYRTVCQGLKVCAEIVMEACDAGLVPEDEEVIAVAGTGWGADTVCVVKSRASKRFLDLRILEILAKPRA